MSHTRGTGVLSAWLFALTMTLLAAGQVLLILLPLAALFLHGGLRSLLRGMGHPVALPALWLSLVTTVVSLVIVVGAGTPLAWRLARSARRSSRWLETILQLPMVMPPSVAGIALLLAFGRKGMLGSPLHSLGWSLGFSSVAVVMAQVFVSSPFYLQAAVVAFGRLDANLLGVARSLGATPARVFFAVALPLARPALLAGAATAWARALGEFGATLMFAGNVAGKTQTLPLAIYAALETDLHAARALSVLLVLVAFALLLLVRGRAAVAKAASYSEEAPP
ncbi:MAG TPA: ABC transporter permease [Polyangia bacterium]|jgi:NifC-like ABC-type porter/molybdate ABC transporter, permease protein|nr:ABC transporter permease [Polyangia bacterium]